MSEQHTKEPWLHDFGTILTTLSDMENDCGVVTEICRFPNTERGHADLRRVKACVNALAGVPTETLEAISPCTFMQTYDARTTQRDALLAALKEIAKMTDAENADSYRSDDREGCLDAVNSAAVAAIAAAGGAQ